MKWRWLSLLAFAGLLFVFRHFTVDDALIAIRYARNIRALGRHVFNPEGIPADGVTPLVYPWLLAPLMHGTPLESLAAAKGAGEFVLFGAYATFLWRRAAESVWCLTLPFWILPAIVYAGSGMETPWAASLLLLAVTFREEAVAASLLAGTACLFRPELVVWSLAFSSVNARQLGRRGILVGAISITPFFAVALVRLVAFGRLYPLSLLAKPSDLSHGLTYVAAGLLLTGAPIALLSLERGLPRVLTIAFLCETLVFVAVGGDWMPFARLFAPVLPTLLVVQASRAPEAIHKTQVARRMFGGAGAIFLLTKMYEARDVELERKRWIALAEPALRDSKRIAALDIGWVSAAAPHAELVDLAGLTDPSIAKLPGGHTSKRIDPNLFVDRQADTWVLWGDGEHFPDIQARRTVDERLRRSPLVIETYHEVSRFPAAGGAMIILKRTRPP